MNGWRLTGLLSLLLLAMSSSFVVGHAGRRGPASGDPLDGAHVADPVRHGLLRQARWSSCRHGARAGSGATAAISASPSPCRTASISWR